MAGGSSIRSRRGLEVDVEAEVLASEFEVRDPSNTVEEVVEVEEEALERG